MFTIQTYMFADINFEIIYQLKLRGFLNILRKLLVSIRHQHRLGNRFEILYGTFLWNTLRIDKHSDYYCSHKQEQTFKQLKSIN